MCQLSELIMSGLIMFYLKRERSHYVWKSVKVLSDLGSWIAVEDW